MRRLRATAGRGGQPRTPTAQARNNVRAAVTLLGWLRARGTELSACGQGDTGQWLRTGPAASLARDFLTRAGARHHCVPLTIPAPARVTGPAISPDQRQARVARLMDDTAPGPAGRVAGSLLLLYGQPPSRIAAMTTSQITRRDDTTLFLPGRHEVPAPAPPAEAAGQLTGDGRTHRGTGSPAATTWLFPGHLPGRPITPSRPGERLRDIGNCAQTGRRATMPGLAAQLPAAVLADLPGLHENTAAKRINQAGGDWTRYAAEPARNHPRQH
jgi:hypothetical protein